MATAVGPRAQLLTADGVGGGAQSQSLALVTHDKVLEGIRRIARTLDDEPGLTAADLAERVGYGRRHMTLLLLRLEEHGHVVREGRRWFPGPETVR